MNQQEIERWIAANGGSGAVQYTTAKRRIPNPAKTMILPDGSDNPAYDPTAPATIEVTDQKWVNSKTGATLHVNPKDDGTFDVVENTGGDPNKSTATAQAAAPGGKPYIDDGPEAGKSGRRWGWNPETKLYDRDLGPSPAAQKPDTESSRQPVQGKPGTYLVTTKKDGQTESHYEDEAGNRIPTPAEAPKPVSTNTTEPYIVQAGPDGKLITTPNPNYQGEKPQRSTVTGGDGKTYVVTVDKNGNATAAPVEGLPAKPDKDSFAVEPAGLPALDTNVNDQQLIDGVYAYSTQLSAQVKLYHDSGGKQGISPDDATKLANRRADYVENILKQRQQAATTQSGIRGQDITQRGQTLTDTQNRRSTATGVLKDTEDRFGGYLKYLSPDSAGTFVNARNDALANARGYIDAYGGLRESPEVDVSAFPALAAYRQQAQAGIQQAASGGPQIFQARPPASPPVDVPVSANPISGEPISVPPVADPAAAAAEAARQQAIATQAGGAVLPPSPYGPGIDGPPPGGYGGPGVNPPVGEPGNDPTRTVGLLPPRFVQEARYGQGTYYDPHTHGAELAARLGIPEDVFRQAVGSLWG